MPTGSARAITSPRWWNLISRLSPQLRTMNNILRLLSDRLHCTLVLTDRALSRKASAAWPLANEWDYPLILGLVNELQPGQRSGAAVELDDRSVWVWDFPVKGRRSQGLHLLALDESGAQKGSRLEQAAEVVGLFLNVWNRDANFEGTDALVHAILSDRPEEMRRLASRMGIDVSTIHSLLVLRLRDAGGETARGQRAPIRRRPLQKPAARAPQAGHRRRIQPRRRRPLRRQGLRRARERRRGRLPLARERTRAFQASAPSWSGLRIPPRPARPIHARRGKPRPRAAHLAGEAGFLPQRPQLCARLPRDA